jgi:hypothetical protein
MLRSSDIARALPTTPTHFESGWSTPRNITRFFEGCREINSLVASAATTHLPLLTLTRELRHMVEYAFNGLRALTALSAAAIAIGYGGTAQAQTRAPTDTMERCQQLNSAWNRYNGGSSYSKQIEAEAAFEECRKGNLSAGIAGLTRALERQKIPLPPVETANPPPAAPPRSR